MSVTVNAGEQSLAEVRTYPCDFSNDLREAVEVTAVTAEHIPPPGGTVKTATAINVGPIVHVTLPYVADLGIHYLKVLAFLSDGDVSEMRLSINVRY